MIDSYETYPLKDVVNAAFDFRNTNYHYRFSNCFAIVRTDLRSTVLLHFRTFGDKIENFIK